MARTKLEVTAVVDQLRESAEANGGKPNLRAVVRATGVPRTTLRRWWAAATSPVATSPTDPPGASADPADPPILPANIDRARRLLTLDEREARVEILARAIQERNSATNSTVRARLTIAVAKLTRELRALEPEVKPATLRTWPDEHLEVAMRVFAKRHGGQLAMVTATGIATLTDTGWETRSKTESPSG